MDSMEFLEWITTGTINDAMMEQMSLCIADKVIGSIISALNAVLTLIEIRDIILDGVEAAKYKEILDQMEAYGGIGHINQIFLSFIKKTIHSQSIRIYTDLRRQYFALQKPQLHKLRFLFYMNTYFIIAETYNLT